MNKSLILLLVIFSSVKVTAQEKKLTVIFDIGKIRESINYNDGNNDCAFTITNFNMTPFIAKKYNFYLQFKYPILEKAFIRFGTSSIYTRFYQFQYKSGFSPNDIPIDYNENIANRDYTFSYIDIPLIFDYEIFSFRKLHIYNAIGIISNIRLFKNDEISYIRNYNFTTSSFSTYQKKSNTANENFRIYIPVVTFQTPIQFDFSNKIGLYIEPCISYGLLNLVNDPENANSFTLELKAGITLK